MPTQLPGDPVLLEQTIRGRIRSLLLEVDVINNVQARVRLPESDQEDVTLSTIPDPITGQPRTNIIEIGVPVIEESPYTSDECTQLNLTYPITVDVEAVDFWDKPGLEFNNTQDLILAMYMRARRKFKQNIDLGYQNCVHEYLQQVSAENLDDDESGGKLHALDWSITVVVTGVLV